jgi:hypothetical protein
MVDTGPLLRWVLLGVAWEECLPGALTMASPVVFGASLPA